MSRNRLLCSCVMLLVLFGVVGCAQNTEQNPMQETKQVTPTKTEQAQAAQGNQYNFYVVNGPGKDEVPYAKNSLTLGAADGAAQLASLKGSKAASTGATTDEAAASYVQSGVSITVNTGSTSPSLAGTTTGTATQTASLTGTQAATQEVKPGITIPVSLVFGAGNAPSIQASATVDGTTSGQNQANVTDLKTQADRITAQADRVQGLMDSLTGALEKLLGTPATQPASK